MIKNYVCLLLLLIIVTPVLAQEPLEDYTNGTVILDYIKEQQETFNLQNEDIAELIVTNGYTEDETGISYVYLTQTHQGVKIFNAISTVTLKDGRVFNYANRFYTDVTSKVNSTTASQTASSAITAIANHFELGTVENLEELERNGNAYVFSQAGISQRNITAELVYTQNNDQLKLAWDIVIYANDNSHWYSVRIDANSNEILNLSDFLLTCTFKKEHTHSAPNQNIDFFNKVTAPSSLMVDGSSYNVFALPTESPNHGARQVVTNPANTFASPFGWHDDNGVVGAEYTITRGNNVYAQEDRDGLPFTTGFSPDGTASLNFNFPLDINQPPAGYEDVSVTNLFYLNNMMHDIWYQYGFDERSGNFQQNNYGNPGLGGDFVFADAQDGSGTNNATFGTPPDGQNPGMTMFLWAPAGPLSDPLNVNSGSAAGDYSGVGAGFGPSLSTTPITAQLVIPIDTTPDTFDACNTLINTAAINGKIAILRRGECEFGFKVLAAQNAGAIAVIVVNNVPDAPIVMGAGAVGGSVTIPSILISQAEGEAIIASLANNTQSINATLVNNGPFFIDGDFDNGIIAHEYGHGISNRLTGGAAAANCLSNSEQMGEGWSDWFGLMVTMKATDTAADSRGIGTFAISQPITGGGIRPRPYSPDFAVNELTYGITNNTGLSQPHGIGSVWATVLWDLTWAYIDKYGFSDDLYNGDGGNNKVMRIVLQGLKMQPCSPGFVDGRDALLAADMLITGGVDQCIIWDIFAARGLGFNADQGDTDSRIDQVEDFTLPPSNDPSLANCSSLSIDEFLTDTLNIYPNPTQTSLAISTKASLGNVVITLIDINGRIVLTQQSELFDTVNINTSTLQNGLYILNIKGDTINYNEKIIKN